MKKNNQHQGAQNSIISNSKDGFQIRVQPRDSVETKEIRNNAEENLKLIPKDAFIRKFKLHDETAWIVSAGPSLDRLLKNGFLRKEWFGPGSKNKLFTIKHALPILAAHGLSPDFCVVLDPRPIEGISTHGKLRRTLYDAAPKTTKFLVASMTHPSVTSWLIKNGYVVYGWHSAANGLKDLPGVKFFIQGGTCSATRCISVAHFLGFRKCNLVAFDSNLSERPKDISVVDEIDGQKVAKYWPVRIGKSGEFWTTGELIAQIQDLEQYLSDEISDIEINILGADIGTSLVGALHETIVNKTKAQTHYGEVLK